MLLSDDNNKEKNPMNDYDSWLDRQAQASDKRKEDCAECGNTEFASELDEKGLCVECCKQREAAQAEQDQDSILDKQVNNDIAVAVAYAKTIDAMLAKIFPA